MKRITLILIALVFISFSIFAQKEILSPQKVIKAARCDKSRKLKDIKLIPPQLRNQNPMGKEFNKFEKYPFNYAKELSLSYISDPVQQNFQGEYIPNPPIMNFPGLDNVNNSGVPDTEGDIGQNHYFQMTNFSFAICW